MSYSHFYRQDNTVYIGKQFEDFFDALHHTIKIKAIELSKAEHSIVNMDTNKVVCVLRII
jgi:hypothetical protein